MWASGAVDTLLGVTDASKAASRGGWTLVVSLSGELTAHPKNAAPTTVATQVSAAFPKQSSSIAG